ncbi:MAG: tryptophan synthase subunit alpha [Bacteroidetes bacterium]|nr:tryptophan synthase subunit alpha [Bacteroidota bacterium]
MPKLPLMGHLVLGYPTLANSLATARQYADAGVAILELQIPFSDPSADGFVISTANHKAVAQGTTVAQCMEALADLRRTYPALPVIVMTYTNKVYRYGIEAFARQLLDIGITDVIIPDLPPDSLQAQALLSTGLRLVPVLAANIPEERLNHYLALQPAYWYLMADFKITGQDFTLNPHLIQLVQKLKNYSDARIGIGFGISTAEHLKAIGEIADFGIIGSALITAQEQGDLSRKLAELVENA